MPSFCLSRGLIFLLFLPTCLAAVPSDYNVHHQQLEQALERASKQLNYDAVKLGVQNGLRHLAAARQKHQTGTQPLAAEATHAAKDAEAAKEAEADSLNKLTHKAAAKELAASSTSLEKAEEALEDGTTPLEALNEVDPDFLRHFIQGKALQDEAWQAHVQRNARPQSIKSVYKQMNSALPAAMVPEAFKSYIANRVQRLSDFMYTPGGEKHANRKAFPLHQVHALTLGLAVPPLVSPNSGETDKVRPVVSKKIPRSFETAKKWVYDSGNFAKSITGFSDGLQAKAKKSSVDSNKESHKFKREKVDDPTNPGADPFLPGNAVAGEGDPSKADLQQWETTAAPDAQQLAAMQARMDAMQQQIQAMKEHMTSALGQAIPDTQDAKSN